MKDVFIKNTDKIEYEIIDDETLIFNLSTNSFYKLNKLGTFIWKNLDGTKNIEKIIELVYLEFDESKEKIKLDVITFITELNKKKIILEN